MWPENSKKRTEALSWFSREGLASPRWERERSCLLPQTPGPSSPQNTRLEQEDGEGRP